MTYDQARELVDTITHIARLEIERRDYDRIDKIGLMQAGKADALLEKLRTRAATILSN